MCNSIFIFISRWTLFSRDFYQFMNYAKVKWIVLVMRSFYFKGSKPTSILLLSLSTAFNSLYRFVLFLWQSVCVSVNRLIRIWYSHMQQIKKSYIELPWQWLMASTVIPLMNYNSESARNITFYRFHTLLLILAILWWSITINQRLRFNHLLYTYRDLQLMIDL